MTRFVCTKNHVFTLSDADQLICPRCQCQNLSLFESVIKNSNYMNISGSKIDAQIVNIKQDNRTISNTRQITQLQLYEQYEIPSHQIRREKKNLFLVLFVTGVPLMADLFSIFSYLGWEKIISRIYLLPICSVVFVLYIFAKRHKIWLAFSLKADNKSYYKNGYIYEKSASGDVMQYLLSAPCIYAGCDGRILLVDAPPRFKERTFVGVCSQAGREHSVYVDYNFVVSKKKYNWEPLSKK